MMKLWLSSFGHFALFLTPLAQTIQNVHNSFIAMHWRNVVSICPSRIVSLRRWLVCLFEHCGCMQSAITEATQSQSLFVGSQIHYCLLAGLVCSLTSQTHTHTKNTLPWPSDLCSWKWAAAGCHTHRGVNCSEWFEKLPCECVTKWWYVCPSSKEAGSDHGIQYIRWYVIMD